MVQKMSVLAPKIHAELSLFGDGSDGNVTLSSGTTTLTRDMYYNNLTISGTGQLLTKGYRVYVLGILDISAAPAGAIQCLGTAGGAAASTSSGGAAGTNAHAGSGGTITGAADDGVAGNAGQTGAGTAGTSQGALTGNGGGTAASGAGGLGASGAGGALGAAGTMAQYPVPISVGPLQPMSYTSTSAQGWTNNGLNLRTGHRGESGGSGGGDGTNRGGACGGSGAPGGAIAIYANTINRSASTAAGAITVAGANAGAGFAPATGNCGGAGGSTGGGGGWALIVYANLLGTTATNCIDVTGGNGAAGTNGIGTGVGGDGGGSGESGRAYLCNMSANTFTISSKVAAVAGTAHSGINGGAGATATQTRISL